MLFVGWQQKKIDHLIDVKILVFCDFELKKSITKLNGKLMMVSWFFLQMVIKQYSVHQKYT